MDSERFDLGKTEFLSLPPEEALNYLGRCIDEADRTLRSDLAEGSLSLSDLLEPRLSVKNVSLLNYFRANAWSAIRLIKNSGAVPSWSWHQPETANELLYLRRAVQSPGFEQLESVRRCQIETNLGNLLDSVGRFVEAIEHWTVAVAASSNYAMAIGNRGLGLFTYAKCLYNRADMDLFLRAAREDLTYALSSRGFWTSDKEGPSSTFRNTQKEIEEWIELARSPEMTGDDGNLFTDPPERKYREWVLAERLFLNPLNDLGQNWHAAHDSLACLVQQGNSETERLVAFFNQMKQEFIAARYFCYEGFTSDSQHFVDRHVTFGKTAYKDVHSLSFERMRSAFRISYSLFDKIGSFLNLYLNFGIAPKKVNFASIWREADPLRGSLANHPNLPFRGLFWLSKDLYPDDKITDEVTAPEAKDLKEIREHLEHKFLRLVESSEKAEGRGFWIDPYFVRRRFWTENQTNAAPC